MQLEAAGDWPEYTSAWHHGLVQPASSAESHPFKLHVPLAACANTHLHVGAVVVNYCTETLRVFRNMRNASSGIEHCLVTSSQDACASRFPAPGSQNACKPS